MLNVHPARTAPRVNRSKLAEALESRRLLSVSYGTNIITNPGAEQFSGTPNGFNVITPKGWTANGDPTVVPYSAGFLSSQPANTGKYFFSGGPDMQSTDLFQTISLSSISTAIDGGKVKFALSALLGGFSSQNDSATVFVNFQDASKGFINQTMIGPVSAANRNSISELLLRSTTGTVPTGTSLAQVQIHFDRTDGSYNDGYADNLSLVLTGPSSSGGTISGRVLNDLAGTGITKTSDPAIKGVKVILDGKASTLTSSTGAYSFANVAPGPHTIKEIVPATYRATTMNSLNVSVTAGGSATANFLDSQTVLISGTVFNDANGDGRIDNNEKGIAGVLVYLTPTIKTKTDSNGNYAFIEPAGSYVLHQTIPTGFKQVAGPKALTLAKGAVSAGNNFADKHV